jgi:hypothetical protein
MLSGMPLTDPYDKFGVVLDRIHSRNDRGLTAKFLDLMPEALPLLRKVKDEQSGMCVGPRLIPR